MKKHFNNVTRGGQVVFTRLRMGGQVIETSFKYSMVAWVVIFCVFYYLWYIYGEVITKSDMYRIGAYIKACLGGMFKDHIISVTTWDMVDNVPVHAKLLTSTIKTNPLIRESLSSVWSSIVWTSIISTVITIILFFVWVYNLKEQGEKKLDEEFISGVQLIDGPNAQKEINKELKNRGVKSHLSICGYHLVQDKENQHFMLRGTTGVGKSTFIHHLTNSIQTRETITKNKEYRIYVDPNGDFMKKYYDVKDSIILNCLDERHPNIPLYDEISMVTDYELIASSFISDSSKDPFWTSTARTIFVDIMKKLHSDGNTSYAALKEKCMQTSVDDLNKYLEGTPSEKLVDGDIKKTALSILAVLTDKIKVLDFLIEAENRENIKDKPLFSFEKWLIDIDTPNGSDVKKIFITFRQKELKAVKPLIAVWGSLIFNKVMSLTPSDSRRIWLFWDELPKFGKVEEIENALADGRKYGLCFVAGFQNAAQLRKIYGKDGADSIMDLLRTRVYFNNPSADIAEESSRDLGSKEVIEQLEVFSYGSEKQRDGANMQRQRVTRRIVTTSEIQNLDDLEAYIALPGSLPRFKFKLTYLEVNDKKGISAFLPAGIDILDVKEVNQVDIEKDKEHQQEQENRNAVSKEAHTDEHAPTNSVESDKTDEPEKQADDQKTEPEPDSKENQDKPGLSNNQEENTTDNKDLNDKQEESSAKTDDADEETSEDNTKRYADEKQSFDGGHSDDSKDLNNQADTSPSNKDTPIEKEPELAKKAANEEYSSELNKSCGSHKSGTVKSEAGLEPDL